MWTKTGSAAVLLMMLATPLAFRAGASAPPLPAPPKPAANLGAICSNLGDTRPDPAWLTVGYDGDNCRMPRLPAVPDGHAASREQIVAAMAAARAYAVRADAFQKCVGDHLARAARKGVPPAMTLVAIERHRISIAEKNKTLAQRQIDMAVNDFNAYGSDCPDH